MRKMLFKKNVNFDLDDNFIYNAYANSTRIF